MDRLCIRCARAQIVSDVSARSALSRASIRSFTSTRTVREDDNSTKSTTRPAAVAQAGRSIASALQGSSSTRTPGLLVRRQPSSRPTENTQSGEGSQPRLLIRRVALPDGSSDGVAGGSQARPILRRTTGGSSPPGQLLRRSSTPGQGGSPIRRTAGASIGGGAQTQRRPPQQGQQRTRRRRPARTNEDRDEDDNVTEAEVDEYVTKHIARPDNPTEQIAYNPKAQTATELQQDWPNTPLSSTGLTASLVQKIEWLARRLPHGYQTPEQIAEHYLKGNLTRFESQEEKEMVIKIAQELAQKKANLAMDEKGEQVAAEDVSVAEVTSNTADKNGLVSSIIKGEYTGLEKQKMPFLDNIVKTLRNNETYGSVETSKFMAKVQNLMPPQGQRRAAPPRPA